MKENREVGFLAPDGTWYPCDAWCHTETAQKICRENYNVVLSPIVAEKYLFKKGFIGFYSRSVIFHNFESSEPVLLTMSQKEFLYEMEKRPDINDDKLKCVKNVLQRDVVERNTVREELDER